MWIFQKWNRIIRIPSVWLRKIRDWPNIYQAIMVPNALQPYILYESHNALGHNGSTRMYHFIRRHYYWKKLNQHCNKSVYSCPECQLVTSKEPQYFNLHLPIPQFSMSFIGMDLLCPYWETEKGNQYTLTVICMLKNYVFMIPVRLKNTEQIIKAYLTGVYSTFESSKYILNDWGSELASKQFTF